jgi:glycosyltransferase involved in cell wall biosynthesis
VLVPPADADALSEAILRVLTDDILSEQLSENGKRRAQDFHASVIAQEYLDLFRDIISE